MILTFLSENRTFPDILLMALVTVSTIRVTSYLSEELSRDLAKILPFGVLAIFIIDASFFSVVASLDVLKDIRDHSERILYYLLFLIALEFAVRLIMGFAKFVLVGSKKPAPEEPEPAAKPDPVVEEGEAAGRRGGDGGTLSGRASLSCPCRRAYGGGLGASGDRCRGDIRSSLYRVRGRLWARRVLRAITGAAWLRQVWTLTLLESALAPHYPFAARGFRPSFQGQDE